MIRVVLRNAETEPDLLGDFPPDQIPELEALILSTDIYNCDVGDPIRPAKVVRQWVVAEPPNTPRWVLELIWLDSNQLD